MAQTMTRWTRKTTYAHTFSPDIRENAPRTIPNNVNQLQGKTREGFSHRSKIKEYQNYTSIIKRQSALRNQRFFAYLVNARCPTETATPSDEASDASLSVSSTLRTSTTRLENMGTQFLALRCVPKMHSSKVLLISSKTIAHSERKLVSNRFKHSANLTLKILFNSRTPSMDCCRTTFNILPRSISSFATFASSSLRAKRIEAHSTFNSTTLLLTRPEVSLVRSLGI